MRRSRRLSPDEKEGNKVARNLASVINKYFGTKKSDTEYTKVYYMLTWGNFKYNFTPYVVIEFNNHKSPKSKTFINELFRLNCFQKTKHKHQEVNLDTVGRIYLTKEQISELLISIENNFPSVSKITKGFFTYIKTGYQSPAYDCDIIVGELERENINVSLKGLNKNGKVSEKVIFSHWNNDFKYVRKSTKEEIEMYEVIFNVNKYNL